jgi:hypothetical protein
MTTGSPSGANYLRKTFLCLFFAAFLVGMWGFLLEHYSGLNAFYACLQLIVLNVTFEPPWEAVRWQLQIARFFLPLFTGITVVLVCFEFIQKSILHVKIYFSPAKNIFIGVGKTTFTIASLLPPSTSIVVLLPVNELHSVSMKFGRDILFLDVDIDKVPHYYGLLFVKEALNIYLCTGDTRKNIEIAERLVSVLHTGSEQKHLPGVIIETDDMLPSTFIPYRQSFLEYRKRGDIVWLNANAQAARSLLMRHPPASIPTTTLAHRVHIGVVGLGVFARELVLHCIRQGVHVRDEPLHISIFSPDADAFRQFLECYPILMPHGENDLLSGMLPLVTLSHIPFPSSSESLVAPLRAAEAGHGPMQAIYIAEEDDYRCLDICVSALQANCVNNSTAEVTACIAGEVFSSVVEVERLLEAKKIPHASLHIFHRQQDLFYRDEAYPGHRVDTMGIMIHAAYSCVAQSRGEDLETLFTTQFPQACRAAQAEWLQLDEDFRRSSRHAADHLFVKLRELGFRLDRREQSAEDARAAFFALKQAIEERMTLLTQLEHRRFCVERLLDGWVPTSGESVKPLRINKTLTPFHHLDAHERSKDEIIIRALPFILIHYCEATGFHLHRPHIPD